MIILHCLKERTWNEYRHKEYYGNSYIESEGFIHCSDIDTFYKVAPNFSDIKDNLLILCIETEKVNPEIKWEDDGNYGTAYPHIYGLLNTDAIVKVLPFLKDSCGNFLLNPELSSEEE